MLLYKTQQKLNSKLAFGRQLDYLRKITLKTEKLHVLRNTIM